MLFFLGLIALVFSGGVLMEYFQIIPKGIPWHLPAFFICLGLHWIIKGFKRVL